MIFYHKKRGIHKKYFYEQFLNFFYIYKFNFAKASANAELIGSSAVFFVGVPVQIALILGAKLRRAGVHWLRR